MFSPQNVLSVFLLAAFAVDLLAAEAPPKDPIPPAAPQSTRNEPYRPQFHFTYKKGWLSDINGPVFYKGEYHLFSQHCPAGPALEYPQMHWGHAVSTDLVHWRELPLALAPDSKDGPIGSGTALVDWKNTAGFQTGEEPPLVVFYTGCRYLADESKDGVICLAYSNDRGRTWTKYANNPVFPAITHYNRDPKVFWHEPTKRWIMAMTLSCGVYGEGDYRFGLFSSPDLKTWKEESRLEMPLGVDCPDMFELPVDGNANNKRWVFWAGDGTYMTGTFDGKKFTREGNIHLPWVRYDQNGANGYAAQTFSDIPAPDGRKVQIAWLRSGSYPGMSFNQQASFPCELRLRSTPDGVMLCRRPVKEIELLHGKRHHWADKALNPGKNLFADVRGDLFDVRAELEVGAAGGVVFQAYGIPVVYDAEAKKLSCSGKSVALVPVAGRIKLQFLIDRTSLEIFGNDGLQSMTFCFVPPTVDAQLGMSVESAPAKIVSLDVFDMKSIWAKEQSLSAVDAYNCVVGTQTFGATYQFTQETKLVETARAILDMGSSTLKFGMGPDTYYNSPSRPNGIRSLTDLATLDPATSQVLDMPFANYLIWAYPIGAPWYGHSSKMFSPERLAAEYRELYDLSCHLLKTYVGTGKTFYLGHWEGDWLLTDVNPDYTPTPEQVQRMTDWINIRQKAVDDAKRNTPYANVQVYCYLEVNRVLDAIQGKIRATNAVLPKTNVDFVSYSSYDALDPDRLEEALNYIQSHLPPKSGISGKRVFIGEYGFPVAYHSPQQQDERARRVMRAGLAWGCPFVLYWEMYNNEVQNGKQLGFWMIDDRGVKQPVYETHRRFYEQARRYIIVFRETQSRLPSDEELAREAVKWLDCAP